MAAPRCSVLFALPLDRSGFDAVARGVALRDYGGHLMRGEAPDTVWDQRYARIAAAAAELVTAATPIGARVFRRGTLANLALASASSDAVIVLAHWRGWIVSAHDFQVGASAVYERLLEQGLGSLLPSARRHGASSLFDIAADLNAAIEGGALLARCAPALASLAISERLTTTLGRDTLDELLGPMIAPGNRVEMYDGLHTPGEFEASIDPGFAGDLDLATCSSFALATLIAMRRSSKVSLVHTLDTIDPLACCLQITAAFRHIAAHGGRYASARLAVQEMLQEVRQPMKAKFP